MFSVGKGDSLGAQSFNSYIIGGVFFVYSVIYMCDVLEERIIMVF
jgi:hypothetical protein